MFSYFSMKIRFRYSLEAPQCENSSEYNISRVDHKTVASQMVVFPNT